MGLTLGATANGLGRHIYYLDKARAADSIKFLRICEFILILTTVWLKISICLFVKRLLYVQSSPRVHVVVRAARQIHLYCPRRGQLLTNRIFSLKSRPWKIFLWTFIAFNTITSLLDAAIIFPQCTPVELNWDHSIEGHCWSNEAINATGIVQGCMSTPTVHDVVTPYGMSLTSEQ